MRLYFGDHELVAEWVADHIPHVNGFERMTTIGVLDDSNKPLGAVVYHDYRAHDVQLSCAAVSPRWLSRAALEAIFKYPFDQLGVKRVTAMTPSRNVHTRQFLERAGFKQEGVMRNGFPDDDCVVYGMLRDECKWLSGGKHG